jgi:uncharacterized membrane protein YbhN (UPF0104 family)
MMALKLAVSLILLAVLFSRVDVAQLWASARRASLPWLIVAMTFYTMNMVLSTWRWSLLLDAQHVQLPGRRLLGSLLVANFFNNFLPSNIGGDVIRIRDTAHALHSKTTATTVVLVDRALGLLALVLIAAVGASMAVRMHGTGSLPIWPSWLWAIFVVGTLITAPAMYSPAGVGRLLRPLTVLHPEWIGGRIDTMTSVLNRFREKPLAVIGCFTGALIVQGLVVAFYFGLVHSLAIPITWWDLAVIVPLSLVVQMLPLSLNGFGVREAAFSFYFSRIGLPIASAVLLSLVGAALMMLFSLSGAAVYVSRHHH